MLKTSMLKTISGHALSKICFGTMQFGDGSDHKVSQSVYLECRARGINHFDTAHTYTKGLAETWLGAFLRDERDEIFVASKVGYVGGADPKNLSVQFDESRSRLRQDVVDLLYLHRFDPHTPIEKTLAWFAEQKDEGRIRHIGLSNFAAWQIAKAHFIGQTLGAKISAVQPMYSLIKRQAEVEILPACTDLGMQCFSYSPLGAGLLTGKYLDQKGEGRLTTNARYAKRYGIEEMHKCAAALAKIAKEHSVHPATLAVSWILASAFAPSPIVSARSLGQLSPVLAAIDFKMDEATLGMINAVSPMPAPATDRLEEQS